MGVRGGMYWILWYASVLAGFYLLYCPILLLLIFHLPLYRRVTRLIFVMWETFPTALVTCLCGTKIVAVGDVLDSNRSLVIMNHPTRLDWNYFWALKHQFPITHSGGLVNTKIVLKAPVRKIPGLGWIMQMSCFLFLDRKWITDKRHIEQFLKYASSVKESSQWLLFPEGTDLSHSNRLNNNLYAKSHNLPVFNHLLNPRTKGFSHLVQQLRQGNLIDFVFDVTIAYPKTFSQTEMDLFSGKVPEEVHFKVKKIELAQLPQDSLDLEKWLKTCWLCKESELADFVQSKKFDGNLALTANKSIVYVLISLLFWNSLIALFLYSLFSSFGFKLWVICHTVLFASISQFTGGLHEVELFLHHRSVSRHAGKRH